MPAGCCIVLVGFSHVALLAAVTATLANVSLQRAVVDRIETQSFVSQRGGKEAIKSRVSIVLRSLVTPPQDDFVAPSVSPVSRSVGSARSLAARMMQPAKGVASGSVDAATSRTSPRTGAVAVVPTMGVMPAMPTMPTMPGMRTVDMEEHSKATLVRRMQRRCLSVDCAVVPTPDDMDDDNDGEEGGGGE